jgi:hypothetical protein
MMAAVSAAMGSDVGNFAAMPKEHAEVEARPECCMFPENSMVGLLGQV